MPQLQILTIEHWKVDLRQSPLTCWPYWWLMGRNRVLKDIRHDFDTLVVLSI
jgi:hypothetical protein